MKYYVNIWLILFLYIFETMEGRSATSKSDGNNKLKIKNLGFIDVQAKSSQWNPWEGRLIIN